MFHFIYLLILCFCRRCSLSFSRGGGGGTQGVSASAFPLYFTAGPSLRQKREAFNKEREGIIKDTEALFRLRKKQASAAKAQVRQTAVRLTCFVISRAAISQPRLRHIHSVFLSRAAIPTLSATHTQQSCPCFIYAVLSSGVCLRGRGAEPCIDSTKTRLGVLAAIQASFG